MAVCEIWDVKGRLDHPIDYAENPEKTANPKYTDADLQAMGDVVKYATNGDKTERQFFVTGVNCDPTTARDEMMMAKTQWNDESEIVCYHGFQSFKAGEVTPEIAHEVTRRTCGCSVSVRTNCAVSIPYRSSNTQAAGRSPMSSAKPRRTVCLQGTAWHGRRWTKQSQNHSH